MKRFRFSLENVMKYRERQAERERAELQRLHGIRGDLRDRTRRLDAELAEMQASMSGGRAVPAAELAQTAAYVRALQVKRGHLKTEAAACDSHIAAQTQRCMEADRKYRLLEKCRSKHLTTWKQQADREHEEVAAATFLAAWARGMSS